jgi:hypothetical protein
MDLKRLFDKGKQIVDKRGGVDSLKEDAAELKDIAEGKGSLADKAKDAAAAVKDPGAKGEEKGAGAGKAHPGQPHGEGQHRRPQAGQGGGAEQPQP